MTILSFMQFLTGLMASVCENALNVLCDLWAFQLALVGILVSVMTLLFASIVSNVEAYNHTKNKKDINSQYLTTHLVNLKEIFKVLNKRIIFVFFCSLLLFVYSTIAKYCNGDCLLFWLCVVDIMLTMALCAWMMVVMAKVYRQYIKEAK